jgi:squalene-associated FAD-dependent desaturase
MSQHARSAADNVVDDAGRTDVAIVGGGLAGLVCAIALRDSGLAISVLEAERTLGGRARSWVDPDTDDVIDLGPHILLTEYHNMLGVLDLLGTRERIVWQTDPLIRLREGPQVTDMRLHRLPPPLHLLPSFGAVRSVSFRDKMSNVAMLRLAMRFDEHMVSSLDSLSAAELLRQHGVTQRFTEWFWASACMAVLNVPLERCSAAALMRVAAQLLGVMHYRVGFADSALSELFVPGARALIEACGGRIHTATTVAAIACDKHDAIDRWKLELPNGAGLRARFCVLAIPPQSLMTIVPQEWRQHPPFSDASAFQPSPYISTYIWLDRKLTHEKFWARIWRSSDLNTDFYDLSNIRQGWRQRNSVIASNIIFSHRANERSDQDIAAVTLKELAEAFPAAKRARVQHTVINRIPMAIPCPGPGTECRRPSTTTDLEGLYLAGDWTRTGLPASMESAVHSGLAAAEEVWSAIGRPRRLVLPKRPTEGFARWMREHR